jgi:hypothetical protein
MAKRKPAQEDFGFIAEEDFGFVPESKNDTGFVPESKAVAPKGNETLETLADMAVSAPQGVTTWADEIQAGAQAAGKKVLGAEEPIGDIYEQDVQAIRERLGQAKERSPWASTAAEMGTGIATSFLPVLGTGKLATSAGGIIGRGALEGLGTAEDKASWGGAVNTLMGAGAGTLGAGVSSVLKKATTAEPNVIRAGVLGARTAEMQEVGRKSREEIAGKMKSMDLFSNNKVQFDPEKGKFTPVGKLKSLESLEKPTQDKLLQRVDEASDVIQKKKKDILNKVGATPIDLNDLDKTLDDAALKWSQKASGISDRYEQAIKLKDTILNDILQQTPQLRAPNISDLEAAKVRLGKDTANWGKNELLKNIPDIDDLYMDMYSTINQKLRSIIPDKEYARLNDMQSDFLTVKRDLTKAVASGNVKSPTFRNEGLMSRAMSALSSGEETALGAANLAELLQRPGISQAVTGARLMTQEAPSAAMRFLDPSIPAPTGNYREPQGMFEGVKPAFPEAFLPSAKYISPKELINYRIPKSTQGILENKDKVIAKLVQNRVPDDMINAFVYALNKDHEGVPDIATVMLTMFPNIFERTKYKMFDGKFMGGDNAKAADDVSRREDLDSIQRAKLINKINNNKVPEGL